MVEQQTEEWFKAREKRITGSTAGALLGVSPFVTQKQALQNLLAPPTAEERAASDNAVFAYGRAVEETAIGIFELETNETVTPTGFHLYEEWLGASPDGLVGNDAIIEIKSPWGLRSEVNPEFKSIHEQPHYYAQVQIELLCTGRTKCYFFQYANGKHQMETIGVDEQWLYENLPKLKQIWDENIGNGVAPLADKIDRYFELDLKIKALQKEKSELLEYIVAENGHEAGIIGDAVLSKSERQGAVSYAKVVKEYLPDLDLDPYRGEPTTVWSLKR